jgi:hypothetical protein
MFLIPSVKTTFDKRSEPSMFVWVFALIGLLATGVNLQADSLITDKKFNNTDAVQTSLFSLGSYSAHLLKRDKDPHTPDFSTTQAFSEIKLNWRFIGLIKSATSWTSPMQSAFHLHPPLRAPPL